MIFPESKYDELRDVCEVEQFGFIDLKQAYETHTVPSVIDELDVAYNEIDNPDSILGKPSDVFEAFRMRDYVVANGVTLEDGESTK